jgi:hypothetical protein
MQDTLITAIAAVGGAAVGAAGAITSNRQANKSADTRSMREAARSDAWIKEDVKRQRLEELYLSFSIWSKYVQRFFFMSVMYMNDKTNKTDFEKLIAENLKEDKQFDFDRIEFLVCSYFPALERSFREVIQARDNGIQLTPTLRHPKVGENLKTKSVHTLLEQMDIFLAESESFKKSLVGIAKTLKVNQA